MATASSDPMPIELERAEAPTPWRAADVAYAKAHVAYVRGLEASIRQVGPVPAATPSVVPLRR